MKVAGTGEVTATSPPSVLYPPFRKDAHALCVGLFLCYNGRDTKGVVTMPKTVNYNCLAKTVVIPDVYSGDDGVVTVAIDFTGCGVNTWAKWFDIKRIDGTGSSKSLGTGLTGSYTLEHEYLTLGGKIVIEAYAISDTAQREYFGKFQFNVEKILNLGGGVIISDPSVIEDMQNDISALQVGLAVTNEDLTALGVEVDGKAALVHSHDDLYYTETEADALLATKSPVGHVHDDRYYTETEADLLLAGKAALVHAHDDLYYTEGEADALLATKSNVGHDHDDIYYREEELNPIFEGITQRLDASDAYIDANVDATLGPTGFTNNGDIVVSYDNLTRKVTLTGTFKAYFKGERVLELIDGWVSPAHPDVQANYYLYYCDSGFVFSTTPWTYNCLMIAFVQYNSHQIAIRETHGFMSNPTHDHLHRTIGSFKRSGGDFSNFVLASTTAANRRPDISDTYVTDEDLTSLIASLSSKLYNQRYLSGAGVRSFNPDSSEIIALSGNQPYWNQNNGGVWQQTLFGNNDYGAIFVVALPMTADAQSQRYRYMFVQPQTVSASIDVIQALSPSDLSHGDTAMLLSEYVFIGKIIIRYTAGNWTLISVEKLEGTRISQVATPAGNYLSVVSHDATLTGDGTAGSPLIVANDGHTHDTRYYTETEVDTKDATKADKLMATNGFSNGDFSNGATGWGNTGAVITESGGVGIVTGNGGTSAPAIQQDIPFVPTLSRKIYVKAKARVTNAVCSQLYWVLKNELNADVSSIFSHKLSPVQDTWYETSGVIPVTTASGANIRPLLRHQYTDASTANGKVMETDNLIALDLTAIFGAGKEPTALEMDNLLSYFTNSWFNGTSELAPLINILRTKADKTQEAWITPTLLNGATHIASNTVMYMKDSLGFVHMKGQVAVPSSGTTFMQFPVGYKIARTAKWSCNSNNLLSTVALYSDSIQIAAGDRTSVDLTGVSFKAEA